MSPRRSQSRPEAGPKITEHGIQVAVFQWASMRVGRWPCLGLLHATPNAGKRSPSTMAWLYAEGFKKGWPDIELNVWSHDRAYPAWFCELKRPGEKSRPEQVAVADLLRACGNYHFVSNSDEEIIRSLENYLGVPSEERTQFFT